jgi:DNA-binding NarL/FixJ family response regulator
MQEIAKYRSAELAALPSDGLHTVIREQQAALRELESSNRELVEVIEHLLTYRKASAASKSATANDARLSKRELQVLALMVAGKTSKEIGAELGVSFKTAVTHRASIMTKLEVHETASAVREAIRRGLV